MKRLADYTYKIDKSNKFILISDLNLGNISLTNSIEDVVVEIEKKEMVDLNSFIIVQKDSEQELSKVSFKNNRPVWQSINPIELEYLKEKYEL